MDGWMSFTSFLKKQACNNIPGDLGIDPPQIATILIHTFSESLHPTESPIKNLQNC